MTSLRCLNCKHEFKIKGSFATRPCPKCGSDAYWLGSSLHDANSHKIIQRPAKGSPEWYTGKWFRRNDKDWHEDIRSRTTLPNGQVVRKPR